MLQSRNSNGNKLSHIFPFLDFQSSCRYWNPFNPNGPLHHLHLMSDTISWILYWFWDIQKLLSRPATWGTPKGYTRVVHKFWTLQRVSIIQSIGNNASFSSMLSDYHLLMTQFPVCVQHYLKCHCTYILLFAIYFLQVCLNLVYRKIPFAQYPQPSPKRCNNLSHYASKTSSFDISNNKLWLCHHSSPKYFPTVHSFLPAIKIVAKISVHKFVHTWSSHIHLR